MALNPPLDNSGYPFRVLGEYFILRRTGIEFECKVKNGNKYMGKGEIILTTCRIICLNNKNNNALKAFDLPISLISEEAFKQPIFGANYLYGVCKPLLNSLPGDITFKIWLMNGGCGTVAPAYLKIVKTNRRNQNRLDNKTRQEVQSGKFCKSAYVDPSDPSVIYLDQPNVNNNINYNPLGYNPVPQNDSLNFGQNSMNNNINSNDNSRNIYDNNCNNIHNNQQKSIPGVNCWGSISNNSNNNNNINFNNNQYNNITNNDNNINSTINDNNDYPSLDELQSQTKTNNNNDITNVDNNNNYNNNNNEGSPAPYPQQGINVLNNIDFNQEQQNGPRYFGFFGPQLQNNNNANN